jgi:hypothetical protein
MMGGGGKIPEYLDFGVRISSLIRTLGVPWRYPGRGKVKRRKAL